MIPSSIKPTPFFYISLLYIHTNILLNSIISTQKLQTSSFANQISSLRSSTLIKPRTLRIPKQPIMSRFDQNEIPVAYPPAPQGASYVTAPPPVGYPLRDGAPKPENQVPVQTQSRGDGFWKGCCAALCCCCVLDACF